MKLNSLCMAVVALVLAAGCKPKVIPELQRKQAANFVSEAQFALTLRDYARAEPLLAKATELCPDVGETWLNLGVTRRKLGDKSGAKKAFEGARAAYQDLYEQDPKQTDALLQEVYALALLGREADARKVLEKALKKDPENRALRGFSESKQLDRLLADPGFKEIAL